MLKAEIYIKLKTTLSDPQGLTVKRALESLGYKGLADVRIGKLVIIKLKFNDKKRAQSQINGMCKSLLANPVIEDFDYKIEAKPSIIKE